VYQDFYVNLESSVVHGDNTEDDNPSSAGSVTAGQPHSSSKCLVDKTNASSKRLSAQANDFMMLHI